MIYCWFIYSPSTRCPLQPPSSPSLYEREVFFSFFFNFLHENNAIAFLASHAKQAPATRTATDGLPSSLNVWLILGELVCVCERESKRERVQGRHASVMHVMCSGPRWTSSPSYPALTPLPPSVPVCPGDRWMNSSGATSAHSHQTHRCNWVCMMWVRGGLELSILVIAIPVLWRSSPSLLQPFPFLTIRGKANERRMRVSVADETMQ